MAQTGLTGEQFEQLQAAIISAFVSYDDLRMPIRVAFDINLNTIVVQAANLNKQVTQLIEWAEANDKVRELVAALRRPAPTGNPNNPKLKTFDETLNGKEKALDSVLEKLTSRNPSVFTDPAA